MGLFDGEPEAEGVGKSSTSREVSDPLAIFPDASYEVYLYGIGCSINLG
jgi:hypothetical protein